MSSEITEEELEICRKLPPHEWKAGDWAIFHGNPLLIGYESIVNGNLKQLIEDGDIEGWLPHPHHIMELDSYWERDWTLSTYYDELNESGSGYFEGFIVCKGDTERIIASTARLACLRAIEPLLEGQENE